MYSVVTNACTLKGRCHHLPTPLASIFTRPGGALPVQRTVSQYAARVAACVATGSKSMPSQAQTASQAAGGLCDSLLEVLICCHCKKAAVRLHMVASEVINPLCGLAHTSACTWKHPQVISIACLPTGILRATQGYACTRWDLLRVLAAGVQGGAAPARHSSI